MAETLAFGEQDPNDLFEEPKQEVQGAQGPVRGAPGLEVRTDAGCAKTHEAGTNRESGGEGAPARSGVPSAPDSRGRSPSSATSRPPIPRRRAGSRGGSSTPTAMDQSMGAAKRPPDLDLEAPSKKASPSPRVDRANGAETPYEPPSHSSAEESPALRKIKKELEERERQIQELKRQALEEQNEHLQAGLTQGRAQGSAEGYQKARSDVAQEAQEFVHREVERHTSAIRSESQQAVDAANEQARRATEQARALVAESSLVAQRVATLETTLQERTRERDESERTLKETRLRQQAQFQHHDQTMDQAQQIVLGQSQELERLKHSEINLKGEVKELQQQVGVMTTRVQQAEATAASKGSELSRIERMLAKMEADNEATRANNEATQAKADLAMAKAQRDAADARKDATNARLNAEAMAAESAKQGQSIKEMTSKLSAQDSQIKRNAEEAEKQKADIDRTQKMLKEQGEELKDTKQRLREQEDETESLRIQKDKISKDLKVIREHCNTLQGELEERADHPR